MALSFIGSKGGSHTATTAQSVSLTDLLNTAGASVSPAAGDIVIVTVVHASASGNSRTLAQLTPSGYSNPPGHSSSVVAPTAETHVCSLGASYKVMPGTPDTTVSIPGAALSTNSVSYIIECFRGQDSAPFAGVTPTTANGQNTGLANPPSITTPASPSGCYIIGCFGAAVASASAFTNTGATPYDSTTNLFKSATQNTATNRSVAGMGVKTGVANNTAFDAAITGSTTTNTGSWAALSMVLCPLVAPVWSSSTTANVAENATLSYTMVASDAASYSIVGGADQAKFEISGTTLRWASNGTKNYESPDDADTNNTYVVTLRATNAAGTADQTVTVTVTNVAEVTLAALTWGTGGSVAENSANSTAVGTLAGKSSGSSLSLTDDAGGRFAVDASGNVTVANGTLLDYETNTSHNITVRETHSDASNSPRDTTLAVTVTDVATPSITSSSTASVAENATLSHSLTVASGTPTWSIVGGADQAKFEISGSTLRWASNGTKNFEAPDDADANNVYVVTVRATISGETADQTISVTVTDVAEGVTLNALTWASGGSVAENSANGTFVGGVGGRTSGSTLSLFNDAGGRFTITGLGAVNVLDGSLIDYESFTSHNITVRETYAGATNTPRDTVLTVTVTDVATPVITSSATVSVAENSTLAHSLTVASGTPTWSIVGGADQTKFEISGSTLRWASDGTKNYEAPDDADANNVYVVSVRAIVNGESEYQSVSVTVTDVSEGGVISGNATFAFTGSTFNATSLSSPVTAGVVAKAANVVTFGFLTTSYASQPVLQTTIASGATSPANAITNNSYIEYTLTGTGSLKRIRFNAAKGGATSNRGFSIRTSNDSYATEVLGVLDIPTVRPNWTAYDTGTITIPFTSGELKVRFYLHAPGTSSTSEWDDVIFDVQSGSATRKPYGYAFIIQ